MKPSSGYSAGKHQDNLQHFLQKALAAAQSQTQNKCVTAVMRISFSSAITYQAMVHVTMTGEEEESDQGEKHFRLRQKWEGPKRQLIMGWSQHRGTINMSVERGKMKRR